VGKKPTTNATPTVSPTMVKALALFFSSVFSAKVATPVKKTEDRDLTFKLKLDI
jgi:hypothetical protein